MIPGERQKVLSGFAHLVDVRSPNTDLWHVSARGVWRSGARLRWQSQPASAGYSGRSP